MLIPTPQRELVFLLVIVGASRCLAKAHVHRISVSQVDSDLEPIRQQYEWLQSEHYGVERRIEEVKIRLEALYVQYSQFSDSELDWC
jgi:hypothetical protein